jgi:hypothetical protein
MYSCMEPASLVVVFLHADFHIHLVDPTLHSFQCKIEIKGIFLFSLLHAIKKFRRLLILLY